MIRGLGCGARALEDAAGEAGPSRSGSDGCVARTGPATMSAIPNFGSPAAHGNAGGMPSSHPRPSPGPSTGADRQDRVCRSTAGVDTVEEIPDALVAARRFSRWPSEAPRGRGGSPTAWSTVIARLQAPPFPPCFRALGFFSGSAEIVGSRGPFEGSNPPLTPSICRAIRATGRPAPRGAVRRPLLSAPANHLLALPSRQCLASVLRIHGGGGGGGNRSLRRSHSGPACVPQPRPIAVVCR